MKKKLVLILFFVLLLLLAAIPSVYYYGKYQTLQKQVNGTETKEDVAALTALVGKLILLPEGETPTVMTVTDTEKLSGQEFFLNAKNGDKVLIYKNAKRAFLYDPAANKIIEVGPLVVTSPSPSVAPVSSPSAKSLPVPSPVKRYATGSSEPKILVQ